MVLTVLTAIVEETKWATLQGTYKEMTVELPAEIKFTCLVQDQKDSSIWKILTIWESQKALDNMRASGETPTGVVIFRTAGASPNLEIFDIHSKAVQF